MLELGNECFDIDGGHLVRNASVPDIRDANRVSHVTAATPDAIDRLLAQTEQEFAGFPHRSFHLDLTTSPLFEARLAMEGYRRGDALVMVLEGELRGEARKHNIRPVETALDWQEATEKAGAPSEPEVGRMMARSVREKCPPVRFWLAYLDGHPCAFLSSWAGTLGIGQIEDLFTDPAFRHRGVAAALIHHCVADCRALSAGPLVLVADPSDTSKNIYAAMGFRPIAVQRSYWKNMAPVG